MNGLKYALAMLGVGSVASAVATEADASTLVTLDLSAFDAPQGISLEGGPAQFYYGAGIAKVGLGTYAPAAILGVNPDADARLGSQNFTPGLPGAAETYGNEQVKIGVIVPVDPSDPTGPQAVNTFPLGFGVDSYVHLTFNANSTQYVGTAHVDGGGTLRTIEYDVATVPEPAAWGLMIGGFGLAGATLRKRRQLQAAQ